MEGFCEDYARILEGAGWSITPGVGHCKKVWFCYNIDRLWKDYMRIMMIIDGSCWDSWRIVEGSSKDYVRIMKEYWRIMEGFCEDYVRILEGAGWSIAPRVGYCKRERFSYNIDGLWKDYMRIMMIMDGLCWDSGRVVEGSSKDYVRIMKEYWRIMEGFCEDYVRILEGAGWSIAPRVGYCKRERFSYNIDGLWEDYMRIMMIMDGLCWDSERAVGGFSKDYVMIMKEYWRIMEGFCKDYVRILGGAGWSIAPRVG